MKDQVPIDLVSSSQWWPQTGGRRGCAGSGRLEEGGDGGDHRGPRAGAGAAVRQGHRRAGVDEGGRRSVRGHEPHTFATGTGGAIDPIALDVADVERGTGDDVVAVGNEDGVEVDAGIVSGGAADGVASAIAMRARETAVDWGGGAGAAQPVGMGTGNDQCILLGKN